MELSIKKEKFKVIGVKVKPCGRVFLYRAEKLYLSPGEKVVVETMFGMTVGIVVGEVQTKEIPDVYKLKKIIRKATKQDCKAEQKNKELEKEAFNFCLERINARGLPMKLVITEVMLDRNRIIFYFTADGRIDFRELVKDLAAKFKTRIEMRQIGVRDEAKMLGGIGVCGRVVCCNSFLDNFIPISIKMAKEQEMVLNTTKLTGLCSRLMCCLSYEYEGKIEGEDEIPISDESIFQQCCSEKLNEIKTPKEDCPKKNNNKFKHRKKKSRKRRK